MPTQAALFIEHSPTIYRLPQGAGCFDGYHCQAQESPTVSDKLAYTEDNKHRMDELVRTVDLKNADVGGLIYMLKTPEECPAYDPTQKLTVREMTAEELRLNPVQYELSAQSGTVTDPFFYTDTDFIARHAKLIASGENYSTDYASYDCTPEYFYGSVGRWFGEADVEGLKSSTVALCCEYAKRMESGGSLELRSLETTFDICGEKLTLGQILDMWDMAKLLSGSLSEKHEASIHGIQIGSDQAYMCAMKGLMCSAASAYARTLPETLGKPFEERLSRLYDNNMQKTIEWNRCFQKYAASQKQDYEALIESSMCAYADFSKVDFSSMSAARSSFKATLAEFDKMTIAGGNGYFSKSYCDKITSVFEDVCKLLV